MNTPPPPKPVPAVVRADDRTKPVQGFDQAHAVSQQLVEPQAGDGVYDGAAALPPSPEITPQAATAARKSQPAFTPRPPVLQRPFSADLSSGGDASAENGRRVWFTPRKSAGPWLKGAGALILLGAAIGAAGPELLLASAGGLLLLAAGIAADQWTERVNRERARRAGQAALGSGKLR